MITISIVFAGCTNQSTSLEEYEVQLSIEELEKAKSIVGDSYINQKINEGKIKRVGDIYYVDLAFKGSKRYFDFNMMIIDPLTDRELVSDLKTPENLDYCRKYLTYRGFPEDQKNSILNTLISKDSFSKITLNETILNVITTQAQAKERQDIYNNYLKRLPPKVSDFMQIKFPQASTDAINLADLFLKIFERNKFLIDIVADSDFDYEMTTSSISLITQNPFEKSIFTDDGKDGMLDTWTRYISGSLSEEYWNLDKQEGFEVKKIYKYDAEVWRNFSNFKKEYRNTGAYPITTDFYKECVLYDYKRNGEYGIIIGVIIGPYVYRHYGADKYYPFEVVIDFYEGKTKTSDINFIYDQFGIRNKGWIYIDPDLPPSESTEAKIEEKGKILDEVVRLLMDKKILVPTVPEDRPSAPGIQIN
ncbi:MAG: hypothetical protein APG12_01598 [Candidatus Methanofastidiosum methylothiophilum]|uniref:Uncharacterized protein n=1 Tax=Candidatus Methanofastidiosum methylothiophilum TaxID=1705564 RepID=A0A150IP25_9EURY|nr:MAG: hypothetical protein APG10_00008 [Candidatus Methanofastidiosum methylthiophilus]KYC46816.1 MAG: hypothetical protein APG11_01654 [Candidatus Methanofastidiosum methylthiophilus]KYC49258.1 MAG: hypothetical protein APG12_01598 [Candidatus Methanofastidiosum methylthiophilus]